MSRRVLRIVLTIAVWLLIVGFPWLPFVPSSWVDTANQAGEFAIVAISLVLLTGWVGQISLAQGTFVGIGAFVTGLLVREIGIDFPVNLPLVALISGAVAGILGLVALRVRGLYLAVATLIFAWMADAYLFTSPWLVGRGGSSAIENKIIGRPDSITSFDLNKNQVKYIVILAVVVATVYLVNNLKESKTGRAFFAVRGSEMAAVSLGIDITRYKLLAFSISGAFAGIAGNLALIDLRSASPVSFDFTKSLFYLSMTVVGGITSPGGAIGAAVLFAGLNEVFFRVPFLNDIGIDLVAVALLLVVLLLYPGGLGAIGPRVATSFKRLSTAIAPLFSRILSIPKRDEAKTTARVARVERATASKGRFAPLLAKLRRRPGVQRRSLDFSGIQVPREAPTSASPTIGTPRYVDWRTYPVEPYPLQPERKDRPPILEAENIIVRFGGLTAVDDMSVVVREHEIVGLIGPNGAGKTTCFNAISGLNEPAQGTIRLFGQDATELPVHVRAQIGVGRTFQLIQLFPQLTVFDNLLVATHVNNPSGVLSHLGLTDKAAWAEREARAQVRQIVGLLGLEEVADRRVAGLPFGILRQVEIARALVTRAPFLMLDEPASGLDNNETDELTRLLYFIRAELGVSILLIEHDVKMVTSVSDYMYVIDRGEPLAEGIPSEIQRNPEVIAAYLGEAIEEVTA